MKILEKFIINENVWIEVVIPSDDKKINYFYEPTAKLHQFDEASAILRNNKKKLLLYKNTVDEIFFKLRYFLNKVIKKEFIITDEQFIGKIDVYYNIDKYRQWKNDEGGETLSPDALEYLDYFLYSSDESQTWLYSDGKVIYMEVGYSVPCLFSSDMDYSDKDFELFLKNYKNLFFEHISFDTALEWIALCTKMLNKIGVQ